MSRTTWGGPIAAGDKDAGIAGGPNIGLVLMTQTIPLAGAATGTYNKTLNLPNPSQIVEFIVDVQTAFDNAASSTVTAGTAPGGTQFLSSVDLKTAGRAVIAPTAAQIAAFANVTAPIIVSQVQGAGAGVAGAATLIVTYVQKG